MVEMPEPDALDGNSGVSAGNLSDLCAVWDLYRCKVGNVSSGCTDGMRKY